MKPIKLTFALAAILLIATPLTSFAAPPHTGIQGRAFLYSSFGWPVEIAPGLFAGISPVQLPVISSFTIYTARTGRQVERVTTDSDGTFSVSLPPGHYEVKPDALWWGFGGPISPSPVQVTVHPREFTTVSIVYFSPVITIFGSTNL